jgi:hypothetical protein
MWRLDLFMAHEGVVAPALIIRDNQNYIGLICLAERLLGASDHSNNN